MYFITLTHNLPFANFFYFSLLKLRKTKVNICSISTILSSFLFIYIYMLCECFPINYILWLLFIHPIYLPPFITILLCPCLEYISLSWVLYSPSNKFGPLLLYLFTTFLTTFLFTLCCYFPSLVPTFSPLSFLVSSFVSIWLLTILHFLPSILYLLVCYLSFT